VCDKPIVLNSRNCIIGFYGRNGTKISDLFRTCTIAKLQQCGYYLIQIQKKKFEVYHTMYRLFTQHVDFEKIVHSPFKLSPHNPYCPYLISCALILGLLNHKAEGIVTL